MDTLVARYTRSPFDTEGFSSEDQQDYTDSLPPLSLKFALPPVARVSYLLSSTGWSASSDLTIFLSAFRIPSRHDRRLCKPKLPR